MMRQHAPVVDVPDSVKPGEAFAVVPKLEAINGVDDPNLRRRACPGCLAFRLATSAMESIHRRDRPEPHPVLLPSGMPQADGSSSAVTTTQVRTQGQRSSAVNYVLAP